MEEENISFKYLSSEVSSQMVPCVQAVGKYSCNDTYVIKRKKYNSILIIFTIEGMGYLKYQNKQYKISKGKGVIIDCNKPHVYFTGETGEWKFLWVHFKGGQSQNQVEYILDRNGPLFTDPIHGLIHNRIRSILEVAGHRGVYNDIVISGFLNEMMNHLMLNTIQQDSKNTMLPEIVSKAIEIIESNYAEQIGLDNLAKQLFVNKYYLIRVFKKHMGITPYDYLIKCRLNQAKSLLENSNLPISNIALKVGFVDSSYFIKVFKQHEDTTPLGYRKYWSSLHT